jgi:hypothetical protein
MANSKIPNVDINDTLNTQRLRFNQLLDSVGDVSTLTTTGTDVASAINEMDAELGTITAVAMGTSASTVGGAIAELDGLLDSISDTQLTTPIVNTTTADVSGNLTVDGLITARANVQIGNSSGDLLYVNSSIATNVIPGTDNNVDLGSSSKEWRDLYIDGTAFVDNLEADSATISGFLDVTGVTTLDSAIIDGPLDVNNIATLDSANITTLDVSGGTTMNTVTVSGASTFNEDVTISKSLTVDSDFTVSGTFIVQGEQKTAAQYIFLLDGTEGAPSENAGLVVDRGSADSAILQWNETGDYWEAGSGSDFRQLARQDDSATFTNVYIPTADITNLDADSASITTATIVTSNENTANIQNLVTSNSAIFNNDIVIRDSAYVTGDLVLGSALKTDNVEPVGSTVQFTGTTAFQSASGHNGLQITSNDSNAFVSLVDTTEKLNLQADSTYISGDMYVQGSGPIRTAGHQIIFDADNTGSPPTAMRAGITVERGSSANKSLVWDEQNDYWDFGTGDDVRAGEFRSNSFRGISGDMSITSETAGDITLDAADDIFLKPTGDNIFMQGVTSGEQITFTLGTTTQSIEASDRLTLSGALYGVRITSELDMTSSNKIVNLATPTSNNDAATKAYVDSNVGILATTTDIAGDTGTDTITIGTDTLTFTGGTGIVTAVTDNTLTINGFDSAGIQVLLDSAFANATTISTGFYLNTRTPVTPDGSLVLDAYKVLFNTDSSNGGVEFHKDGQRAGGITQSSGLQLYTALSGNKGELELLSSDLIRLTSTAEIDISSGSGAIELTADSAVNVILGGNNNSLNLFRNTTQKTIELIPNVSASRFYPGHGGNSPAIAAHGDFRLYVDDGYSAFAGLNLQSEGSIRLEGRGGSDLGDGTMTLSHPGQVSLTSTGSKVQITSDAGDDIDLASGKDIILNHATYNGVKIQSNGVDTNLGIYSNSAGGILVHGTPLTAGKPFRIVNDTGEFQFRSGTSLIKLEDSAGEEVVKWDYSNRDLKLYVGDSADAATLNSTWSGDDLTVQGDVTSISDVRTKENIQDIENGLSLVETLRGVWYHKIGEEDRKVGVIAQEVEEVLPEVVKTDAEGMKSVDYGKMVGVLIEAIKELKSEVDELKTRLGD